MSRTAFILSLVCLSGVASAAASVKPHGEFAAAAARQESADNELRRLREQTRGRKSDPEAWRDYGEALARAGDARGALKAFAESVKRYVKLYVGGSKRLGSSEDEGAAGHRAAFAAALRRAPETIGRYLELGGADSAFERSQLEAVAAHARMLGERDPRHAVFIQAELDQRAVITYKPEPGFTEAARQNNTKGVVTLRAVLAHDGTVGHVFVVRGLPDGLTENCVEAARRIRFKPALKGGTAVSQFIILEYFFNIY